MNVRTIPLYVFTVELTPTIEDTVPQWYSKVKQLLSESAAWILDIDLDFYSTTNPFKDWFTEVVYRVVLIYILYLTKGAVYVFKAVV